VPTYYVVGGGGMLLQLSRFDGVRFGYRCNSSKGTADLYKRSRGEDSARKVKRRIMTARKRPVGRVLRCLIMKAQKCGA